MLEALTYSNMINELKSRYGDKSKVIGILIARPSSILVKDEILSNLNHFHHRSGTSVDFFMPGYGAYWHNAYPDEVAVCNIGGVKWSFSTEMFCKFIQDLEDRSKWRYSGEAELILVDYVDKRLDFTNSVTIWLDQALRDNAIVSVPNLFECIFRTFRINYDTYSVSNSLALRSIGKGIVDMIKEQLPFKIGDIYDKTKYFCVRDLSI